MKIASPSASLGAALSLFLLSACASPESELERLCDQARSSQEGLADASAVEQVSATFRGFGESRDPEVATFVTELGEAPVGEKAERFHTFVAAHGASCEPLEAMLRASAVESEAARRELEEMEAR